MTSTCPLRTITDLEPGEHLCYLYETNEELRALLVPFLRKGLEQGEKVFCIMDDRTEKLILDYLRDEGLEIEPYLKSGQLSILTGDDTYLRDSRFNPEEMIALLRTKTEQALVEGYTALRIAGEMTWALRGLPGSDRLIEYEAKLNTFFPNSKCLAICLYDWRRFDPIMLSEVLTTHPKVIIDKEVYDNFYYIPSTEFLGNDISAETLLHRLENLTKHKQTEEMLQKTKEELEHRIAQQIADLRQANKQLQREITERKWAEESLQAERDNVQQYLDVAGVILVVINEKCKVTLINKKGCEVLGYQEQEILDKDWFATFLPERIREEVKTVFQKLLAGELELVEYFKNPVLTKNGEERIIAWHNTLL
ncbi:MAG: MEDS domain-containing protein, partial [Candidatus Heimdallarchaeota archaeon]